MIECQIKYFDDEMPKLEKISIGDWIDVRIRDIKSNGYICKKDGVFEYPQFSFLLVKLGFAMKMPDDYEGWLIPRSSLFKNSGLIQTNSIGLIDNSYCGDEDEWLMPLFSLYPGKLEKYQRIGQFRLVKKMESIQFDEVSKLGFKTRGGHGSTGKF